MKISLKKLCGSSCSNAAHVSLKWDLLGVKMHINYFNALFKVFKFQFQILKLFITHKIMSLTKNEIIIFMSYNYDLCTLIVIII